MFYKKFWNVWCITCLSIVSHCKVIWSQNSPFSTHPVHVFYVENNRQSRMTAASFFSNQLSRFQCQLHYKDVHHTCNMLLHYLWKFKMKKVADSICNKLLACSRGHFEDFIYHLTVVRQTVSGLLTLNDWHFEVCQTMSWINSWTLLHHGYYHYYLCTVFVLSRLYFVCSAHVYVKSLLRCFLQVR